MAYKLELKPILKDPTVIDSQLRLDLGKLSETINKEGLLKLKVSLDPNSVKGLDKSLTDLQTKAQKTANITVKTPKLTQNNDLVQITKQIDKLSSDTKLQGYIDNTEQKIRGFSENVSVGMSKSLETIKSDFAKLNNIFQNVNYQTDGKFDISKLVGNESDYQSAIQLTKELTATREKLNSSMRVETTRKTQDTSITKSRVELANLIVTMERYQKANTLLQKDSGLSKSLADNIKAARELNDLAQKGDVAGLAARLRDVEIEFGNVKTAASEKGLIGKTFLSRLTEQAQKLGVYVSGAAIVMGGLRQIREMINNVMELDTVITDLQIATGYTRERTKELLDTYSEMGKAFGATTVDVAKSADTWLRMGHTVSDSNKLIKDTLMLSKLGQIDSAEAARALTSAQKGYKVSVEETTSIVDKLTAVDMNAAVGAGYLAKSMAETATGARLAGVDMDRLIGYIASVGEITQDGAESVGNFYKTLFARMGNIKLGKLIDPETQEDLSNVEVTLEGLGIKLRENGGEFRNFGTVLDEVAKGWNSYGTVQQRALAVAFSGTLQQEKFLTLMDSYGSAMNYAEIATNSAGTALDKYENSYLKSVAASQEAFNAQMEQLSKNVVDSDLIKFTFDSGTGILGFFNALIKTIGEVPTLLSVVSIAMSAMNKTGSVLTPFALTNFKIDSLSAFGQNIANLNKQMNTYNNLSQKSIGFQNMYNQVLQKNNTSFKQYLNSLNGANASMAGYGAYLVANKVKTLALATAQTALNAAWSFGISFLISTGINALTNWINKEEIAAEKAKEAIAALDNQIKSLEGTKNKVVELRKALDSSNLSHDEANEKRDELYKIQEDLIKQYGTEAEKIDLVTGSINAQKEAIDNLKTAELSNWFDRNQKVINDAVGIFETSGNIYYTHNRRAKQNYNLLSQQDIADIGGRESNDQMGIFFEGTNEEQLRFLERYITKIKELNSDWDTFGTAANTVVTNLSSRYDHVSELLQENQDEYEKYINYKIAHDKNYEISYEQILKSRSDLEKAHSDGDVEARKKASDDLIGSIVDGIKTAGDDKGVAEYFQNMIAPVKDMLLDFSLPASEVESAYNDLVKKLADASGKTEAEIRMKWGFDINLEALKKNLEDNLKGVVSDQTINDLFVKLQLDDLQLLITKFKEMGITGVDSFEDITNKINNYKTASAIATTQIEKLNKEIDKIQTAYQTLSKAIEEYNEVGYISVDTYQELIELGSNYIDMLFNEQGELELTAEALYKVTEARINEAAAKQANAFVNSVAEAQDEEAALKLLTIALDETSGSTFAAAYATIALIEAENRFGDNTGNIVAQLRERVAQYEALAAAASAGVRVGGMSGGTPKKDTSAKDIAKAQKEYDKKVADINKNLAKKEADAAKKSAELDKKAATEAFKANIDRAKQRLEMYANILETLQLKSEFAWEQDYATQSDILAAKFDLVKNQGAAMREEFMRLQSIMPSNAEEANYLASRIESLGDEIRNNRKEYRELITEINTLPLKAISNNVGESVKQLNREISLLDFNIKGIQEGSLFSDLIFTPLFMLPSIPQSALDKKRKENDEMIVEEQRYQNEIQRIKTNAIEMQVAENAADIAEQKAQLAADLSEARADAAQQLIEAEEQLAEKLADIAEKNKGAVTSTVKAVADGFGEVTNVVGEEAEKTVEATKQGLVTGFENAFEEVKNVLGVKYQEMLLELVNMFLSPSTTEYIKYYSNILTLITNELATQQSQYEVHFKLLHKIYEAFREDWNKAEKQQWAEELENLVKLFLTPYAEAYNKLFNIDLIYIYQNYVLRMDQLTAAEYQKRLYDFNVFATNFSNAYESFRSSLTPISIEVDYNENSLEGYSSSGLPSDYSSSGASSFGNNAVTSNYGAVRSSGKTHKGIDFSNTLNSPTVPKHSGTVTATGTDNAGGNYVTYKGDNGYTYTFYHLNSVDVKKGDTIVGGQTSIGGAGTTGSSSTGVHTHLEVKDSNGNYVDPVGHYATGGTTTENNILVGERLKNGKGGRELGILPNGKVVMFGKNGAELVNVPMGTQIINNEETEEILKYTGDKIVGEQIPKFFDGNSSINVESSDNSDIVDVLEKIEENTRDIADEQPEIGKNTSDIADNQNSTYPVDIDAAAQFINMMYEKNKSLREQGYAVSHENDFAATIAAKYGITNWKDYVAYAQLKNKGIDVSPSLFPEGTFAVTEESIRASMQLLYDKWAPFHGGDLEKFNKMLIDESGFEHGRGMDWESYLNGQLNMGSSTSTANSKEQKQEQIKETKKKIDDLVKVPEAYSKEFTEKYIDFINERNADIDLIKKLRTATTTGDVSELSDDELSQLDAIVDLVNERLEKDLEFSYKTQIEAYKSRADILTENWIKLKDEYEKVKDTADPEELLLYQEGLQKIQDEIVKVDEGWRNANKSLKEYYISLTDKMASIQYFFLDKFRPLNDFWKSVMDNTKDYADKLIVLSDWLSNINDTMWESDQQQDRAHDNANVERNKFDQILQEMGIEFGGTLDDFFTVDGTEVKGAIESFYELINAIDDTGELKRRFDIIIYNTGVAKKQWYNEHQFQQQMLNELRSAVESYESDREQAISNIVALLDDRKQKELEAIEEIHKREMKYLDDRRKIIEDNYRRQISLLDDLKEAEDYQKSLNKETNELDRIKLEIDKYAMIDTEAARTKVSELTKQLNDQQDKINEMQRNKEYQDQKKALEEDRDLLLDNLDKKVEAENDAYEEIREILDDAYSAENKRLEAMEALQAGYLNTYVANSAKAYSDIGTTGTYYYGTLAEAVTAYATEAGEATDTLVFKNKVDLVGSWESVTSAIAKSRKELEAYINKTKEMYSNDNSPTPSTPSTESSSTNGSSLISSLFSLINSFLSNASSYTFAIMKPIAIGFMKQISEAWHTASESEQNKLHETNERLAKLIGAKYNESTWNWEIDGTPIYHTGKIPSWMTKDEELALLKKDEPVLTKIQTENLLSKLSKIDILEKFQSMLPKFNASSSFIPAFAGMGGGASIGDIHITVQGNMDKETYGIMREDLLKTLAVEISRNK